DVDHVPPEHVLIGGVPRSPDHEVARISREAQGAVAHRVHRDIAAGDLVAEGPGGAAPEESREPAGERALEVGEERRWQARQRQLAGAAREVDVLREIAPRADSV